MNQFASPVPQPTLSPQSVASSDSETPVTVKVKKSRTKSADWTEEETHDLLEAVAEFRIRLQTVKTEITIDRRGRNKEN